MSRPRRLDTFSYQGLARYFLTFCTHQRREVFQSGKIAKMTIEQFRATAVREEFVILAYCLMPDHAHLLVEGTTDQSDFRRFTKLAKQRSGAAYALTATQRLWQKGYYERVLRRDDDARIIARYILENPVRAGLVRAPNEYAYLGSDVWSVDELIDSIVI